MLWAGHWGWAGGGATATARARLARMGGGGSSGGAALYALGATDFVLAFVALLAALKLLRCAYRRLRAAGAGAGAGSPKHE